MADIIKQGEWGNGDLTGAHKEVEEGYVKFLICNSLNKKYEPFK